jgi:hypothetical protein
VFTETPSSCSVSAYVLRNRKKAVERADFCAGVGDDCGHCHACVAFLSNDGSRGLQYGGHPEFAIGPLWHLNRVSFLSP